MEWRNGQFLSLLSESNKMKPAVSSMNEMVHDVTCWGCERMESNEMKNNTKNSSKELPTKSLARN